MLAFGSWWPVVYSGLGNLRSGGYGLVPECWCHEAVAGEAAWPSVQVTLWDLVLLAGRLSSEQPGR